MKAESRDYIESKISELDGLHEIIDNYKGFLTNQSDKSVSILEDFAKYVTSIPNYEEVIQTYGSDIDKILSIQFYESTFSKLKEVITDMNSKEREIVKYAIRKLDQAAHPGFLLRC